MKRANAKGAVEDFCAHEILVALVGPRLRYAADPAEVELPCFPAKAILRCQALTDWRTGRAQANVITRAQVAGCYPRHQDILAVSDASD
jgi:hypothetical protein